MSEERIMYENMYQTLSNHYLCAHTCCCSALHLVNILCGGEERSRPLEHYHNVHRLHLSGIIRLVRTTFGRASETNMKRGQVPAIAMPFGFGSKILPE